MDIPYLAYAALTGLLVLLLFPFFRIYARITGRYRDHLNERLGAVPPHVLERLAGSPRIWVHAVSLGEVKVAAAVIPAIREKLPGCAVILSTTTPHGRDLARKTFGNAVPVIYSPVDVVPIVRRALRSIRPHMLVFLETEIWPAWIREAHRMGISTAFVNGRISLQSFDTYRRFAWFFRKALCLVELFSMISEDDAARIRAMGADPARIQVSGNAKYDTLSTQTWPGAELDMRKRLGIPPERSVILAGSTRDGEEGPLLDAYAEVLKRFPETLLVLAPRHIKRAPHIRALVEARGLPCRLRTGPIPSGKGHDRSVIVLDTFGELFNAYSIATVAFCGGSLAPLGGQNPLEPAVWGRPVLYGPHMDNFPDAKALLEAAGGGRAVEGPAELADAVIRLLAHPDERERMGKQARRAVLNHHGASEKHAEAIAEVWMGKENIE
ncbi:MAG: 3-deoxy-D-manno-octulosonic acid transferase [Deltaproteobacteria bacterium]|nr:3-deoxy-D-manno-octulosonic acid transferase [Deltaproteobacteria bacterium]